MKIKSSPTKITIGTNSYCAVCWTIHYWIWKVQNNCWCYQKKNHIWFTDGWLEIDAADAKGPKIGIHWRAINILYTKQFTLLQHTTIFFLTQILVPSKHTTHHQVHEMEPRWGIKIRLSTWIYYWKWIKWLVSYYWISLKRKAWPMIQSSFLRVILADWTCLIP